MNDANDRAANAYRIPENKVVALRSGLDRLLKRASKLGVEPFTYTTSESYDVPFVGKYEIKGNAENLRMAEDAGKMTYRRFVDVIITGRAPVLAGWEFVATLEHLQDDQGQPMNVVRTSPMLQGNLPEVYRACKPNCDHCHQNRLRKDTYVIRKVESREFKQVGSSCLKDFFGNDPRQVAANLEFLLDAKQLCEEGVDGMEMENLGEVRWSLREFLTVTAAVIRENGWVSRKESSCNGSAATADLVVMFLSAKDS